MAWLLAATLASPATSAPPAPKPRPTPEEIAAQTLVIREAFAEALRENQEFPLETSRTLLAAARKTDDPARAWALFDESARLATAARALPDLMTVVTERSRAFDLAPGPEIVAALKGILDEDGEDTAGVFRLAVAAATDAIASEDFAVAKDAIDIAARATSELGQAAKKTAGGRPRGAGMAGRTPVENLGSQREALQSIRALLTDRKRRRAAYDAACETLAQNADDAAANLQAGMYLCVIQGDWKRGVGQLAKSGVAEVAAAAAADAALVEADPPAPRAVLDVGEQWWRIANSLKNQNDATAFRKHVAEMYEQIADDVTDPLDRALIAQRLEQARR